MPELEQCNIEFLTRLNRILGTSDGRRILKALRDRVNQLKEDGITEYKATKQATKEFSDRAKEIGRNRTRQQLINITKYHAAKKFIFSFADPHRGYKSFLGGVEGSKIKGSKKSIDSFIKDVESKLIGTFQKELVNQNLDDAYRDLNNHEDIFEEFYKPGTTKNKEATAIAKIMKQTLGMGRSMLNKRGAAIADLPEYVGRQFHAPDRMLRLSDDWVKEIKLLRSIKKLSKDRADRIARVKNFSYEKWRNFSLPLLDQERTFKGADPEEFMRRAYDNIVDGRYDTNKGGHFEGDFKFTGPGNLAKKISQRRVFHFKDGRSAFAYNEKYGAGTLPGMMVRTINGMARNIGLMEKLGVNPDMMHERLLKDVMAESLKRGYRKRLRVKAWSANNLYKELSGKLQTPIDNMYAKMFIGARKLNVLSRLGGVTLSAMPDLGNMADQLRANGIKFLSSELNALMGTLKGITKEKRIVSDILNVYFESIPQQLAHLYSAIDSAYGTFSKLEQKSYRIFMIAQFDELKRRTIATILSRNLALMKNNEWAKLDSSLQQTLRENGIEEKEWDLIRTNKIGRPYANKEFVTQDDAKMYSHSSISKYLGKIEPASKEIAKVREDMEFNLRSYFLNNTANVNMLPGVVERSWMHMGTDPNTVLGQVIRSVAQFKGFILSMTRRKLGRFYGHIAENGFHSKDVLSATGHFVQLAISLYAYGYLALAAKDLSAGKVPRNPLDPKTTMAALVQGGAAGMIGDFLIGQFTRASGEDFLKSTAGITLNTIGDVVDLFRRLVTMDHPGTAAFYLAKNNIPFINLWYAKAAINYLFLYGIQDLINPGSLERMQRNLEQNYKQHFIFDPSQYAVKFR